MGFVLFPLRSFSFLLLCSAFLAFLSSPFLSLRSFLSFCLSSFAYSLLFIVFCLCTFIYLLLFIPFCLFPSLFSLLSFLLLFIAPLFRSSPHVLGPVGSDKYEKATERQFLGGCRTGLVWPVGSLLSSCLFSFLPSLSQRSSNDEDTSAAKSEDNWTPRSPRRT
jgi:hypothetical protein